jgi:prepilin-type N-terminal cleavage/methylation domain-containing protein
VAGADRGDAGFGLIEVVVALTVLLIISAAVGWVIVSSVGADTLSQQRSAAASLIEQRDAYLQANVPTTSCSTAATTYLGTSTQAVAAGSGGSTTTYTIATTTAVASNMLDATITVSWHAAFPSSQTSSLAGQVQVPCQSS